MSRTITVRLSSGNNRFSPEIILRTCSCTEEPDKGVIQIIITPAAIYVKVIVPTKEEVRNKPGELFDFCHFEERQQRAIVRVRGKS